MGKKTIAKEGREVKIHYKGTLNDGTVFDSSYDRGQTIAFTVGKGEMIPGFEKAINGMRVGEVKNVHIVSDEAYGDHNPDGIQEVNKEHFPEDFEFLEGSIIEGQVGTQPVRGTISSINDATVTVDFNHPMAGKDLNFEIELLEVS